MKTLNKLLLVLLGICISGLTFCVIVGIAVNTNKAMTDSTMKRMYELGYQKGRIDVVNNYIDHHGGLYINDWTAYNPDQLTTSLTI